MGAVQSSAPPSGGLALGDRDRQLLGELTGHSRAAVDECAAVFRGADAALDDEDGRWRAAPYPRRLSPAQFDEVFGMLVADAGPHFGFFQVSGAVVAHQVFCCVALLMRADLRAKVDLVLRLYADAAGRLAPDVKRSLVSDAAVAVARLTGEADPVPGELLTHIEKAVLADDADKLSTVRELFEVCFTDARLSGLLHDLHARAQAFVAAQRRQQAQRAVAGGLMAGPSSGPRARPKPSLSPRRSVLQLLATQRQSVLWETRTGDFPALWRKRPPRVLQAESTAVAAALAAMARDDAFLAVVRCQDGSSAAATTDHFLAYFLRVLRQLESDVAAGAIQVRREQQLQRQAQVERAVRAVAVARLNEVLPAVRGGPCFSSRLCVDEDLPLFHAVLPLTSGSRAVAVLSAGASQLRSRDGDVLGTLDALDVLRWIEQDLSVLNGKHLLPVAAFPEHFYAPATASPASVTVGDALAEMAALRVTGMGAHGSALLSADAFRDAFLATHAQLTGARGPPPPTCLLLTSRLEHVAGSPAPAAAASAATLPRCPSIPPMASLASAIRAMVEQHTRRVLIQRPADGANVGAVRATDVLALLLREQHVPHE